MSAQFTQAVTALLHQNDATVRQQANTWLEDLQHAPHAWAVCSEVLQDSSNMDAKFYAAQTLRTKVLSRPCSSRSHVAFLDASCGMAGSVAAELQV